MLNNSVMVVENNIVTNELCKLDTFEICDKCDEIIKRIKSRHNLSFDEKFNLGKVNYEIYHHAIGEDKNLEYAYDLLVRLNKLANTYYA